MDKENVVHRHDDVLSAFKAANLTAELSHFTGNLKYNDIMLMCWFGT
jgi:hypothetical protein